MCLLQCHVHVCNSFELLRLAYCQHAHVPVLVLFSVAVHALADANPRQRRGTAYYAEVQPCTTNDRCRSLRGTHVACCTNCSLGTVAHESWVHGYCVCACLCVFVCAMGERGRSVRESDFVWESVEVIRAVLNQSYCFPIAQWHVSIPTVRYMQVRFLVALFILGPAQEVSPPPPPLAYVVPAV